MHSGRIMRQGKAELIKKDLKNKLVFITGPRQVGKTWLAKQIAGDTEKSVYLNYDSRQDRQIIEQEAWLPDTKLLVLDEIHKMPGFKNYLKGIFDTREPHLQILVTGSARLDAFRQSGDSLAGRFFRHRLMPFSLSDVKEEPAYLSLNRFLERGGFAEPFLAENAVEADRWRMQYIDGLIRTDILDFENIHDLRALQQVLQLLRERVGSPVSYASIARDVNIASNTVKKYISVFEALFIVFRVSPYTVKLSRSIRKEPKIYFFDTGLVTGSAAQKLENFVAVSLITKMYNNTDTLGKLHELHYLRTKDDREVDFALVKEQELQTMVEVKTTDEKVSSSLLWFKKKYDVPAFQIVQHLKREQLAEGIELRRAENFLTEIDNLI